MICQNKNALLGKNVNSLLMMESIKNLPNTILDNNDHVLDQEPLCDHRHKLILIIVQKYIDIRLSHESKRCEEDGERVRMKFNKLTQFLGQ